MTLSNFQFDEIMRNYEQRRLKNYHLLKKRILHITTTLPEYNALSDTLRNTSISQLENLFETSSNTLSSCGKSVADIYEQKRHLLLSNNYPEDYLDPIYDCPLCKDTGFIGQEKCTCFKQQILGLTYKNFHTEGALKNYHFDLVSDSYYQGEDLKNFYHTFDSCKDFADTFDTKYQNLLLSGTVGTGKSFLSSCIATEVLKNHHTVLYSSATTLFETLSKYIFDKNYKESLYNMREDLYNYDLVIIDDLGTELNSSFISSELFTLINERHIRKKATIISTNHTIEELQKKYSDRIFSRLVSYYIFRILTGPDIRIAKKFEIDRK